MIIGSVGEWIVGNTFPFVVFGTFGAFWLTFGATLQPYYNAYGSYVTDPTTAATSVGQPGNPAGLKSPEFNASFAFFLVFMGKDIGTPVWSGEVADLLIDYRTRLLSLPHLLPED